MARERQMSMFSRPKKSIRPVASASLAAFCLLASPALADVKDGVDAWERGEYAKAVAEWRDPALRGDPDAQFNLGQAYKLGRGVPMDLGIAQDWFKRAADQGHLQAADNLGLILFQNNQRDIAMPYITASAARGEPRAQYVLGTAHFNGDLVEKDWVRAYALMTRASAAGLPQAARSLATMDQYIPLAQRQEGVALAAQLERDADAERNRQLAGMGSSPRPSPPPSGIESTALPPSTATPPIPVPTPSPAPAPTQSAGADYARPTPPPQATPAPTPAPAPAPVAADGAWRVQLGAFSSQDRARLLWTDLERRYSQLGGLQPYLVESGSVTRLQAGGFASRDAAQKICDTLSASGQACFPVRK